MLLALVFVQSALGALTSASYAGLDCGGFADCWRAAGTIDPATLNPFREPHIADGGGAAEPGALVQLLHRLGAGVVAVGAIVVAAAAWRAGRRSAALWLPGLVALQIGLGASLVRDALPLSAALLHNLAAALLVGLLARLR